MNTSTPQVCWQENDQSCSALWRSEAGISPPARIQVADDRLGADAAFKLICEGTTLLWRGDYQNARQLLSALARRVDRKPLRPGANLMETFHRHRQAQGRRAHLLSSLLLPFEAGFKLPLRRAPEVSAACEEVFGHADAPFVLALRELLGLIGAHEWRRRGVPIPALGASIHPHYGVFSPVRGEYVDLVDQTILPTDTLAWDIGCGTGVLAALLARRGVAQVVASDIDPRALACTRDNLARLGLQQRVTVSEADLFPKGKAPLIVCNPPWLPARPSSRLEAAIYDPDSQMLKGFLGGLAAHLEDGGEGWLILSNFAEILGLRSKDELLGLIDAGGLVVAERRDIRPRHGKAADTSDPLHLARRREITSLWRLVKKPPGAPKGA